MNSWICAKHLLAAVTLSLYGGVFAGESPAAEATENVVRQRFLIAYQTAQTPEGKAETVKMLQGLKEKESLRLVAGMLGDRHDLVRRAACAAMAATADPEGYFVKPLMGALSDTAQTVRIAAANALGAATIRADAIKALAFALITVVGQPKHTSEKEDELLILTKAYDSALERLTGLKSKARDPRGLSTFWMDYWKQHEEELRAEDAKKLADEPLPRREGLPPDSFDQKKSNEPLK